MNVKEVLKISKEVGEERLAILHIMLINNHIKEAINNILKPLDISLQQYNVLRILRGQQGKAANLNTITERMIDKMSNTTRLVDKLITKGLVNRAICPSNRRKVEILITEKGLEQLKVLEEKVNSIENAICSDMTIPELKKLNELLHKFKFD